MRAFLAAGLLAGFYVVAAVLVTVFVWLAVVSSTAWTILLAILAALVLVIVVSASRIPPLVAVGPSFPVGPAAQPGLWAELRSIAESAGTTAPEKVVLVPVADAALSEQARALGLIGGPRTLMIGLPLLAGLSVEQFRAVLAHEFGHVTRPTVYRGRDQLDRAAVAFRRNRVLRGCFAGFRRLYSAVASPVLLRREYDADAAAAALTSPATMIAALRERAAIADAWPEYAARNGDREQPPLEFARTLREFIDAREPAKVMVRAADDRHPSLEQRIAALEALPGATREPDERPAFALFEGDSLN